MTYRYNNTLMRFFTVVSGEPHLQLDKMLQGCNTTSTPKYQCYGNQIRVTDPSCSHREVSFGCEPLGEMVEGIWLSADWVAVAMDLVEQVSRLVQAVIADIHVLLFHTLRPPCVETRNLR